MIAISRLNKESGMLVFSLQAGADSWAQQEESVELEPGDGVVWRGGCLSRRGSGEGGLFVTIRYH
jgi:hypothetical protein